MAAIDGEMNLKMQFLKQAWRCYRRRIRENTRTDERDVRCFGQCFYVVQKSCRMLSNGNTLVVRTHTLCCFFGVFVCFVNISWSRQLYKMKKMRRKKNVSAEDTGRPNGRLWVCPKKWEEREKIFSLTVLTERSAYILSSIHFYQICPSTVIKYFLLFLKLISLIFHF